MSRKPDIEEVNWAFSPNPLSNGSMERMHVGISLRFHSWVRSNLDKVGGWSLAFCCCRGHIEPGRCMQGLLIHRTYPKLRREGALCPHQIESFVGGTARDEGERQSALLLPAL